MTKYLFFNHISFLLVFQAQHKVEFHKKLFAELNHNTPTNQNHRALWDSKYEISYIMQNYVFRFNISVYYSIRVELAESLAHLPHYCCNLYLGHWLVFFELLEELPSSCCLHNQINIFCIIKKAVHFDNVCVI